MPLDMVHKQGLSAYMAILSHDVLEIVATLSAFQEFGALSKEHLHGNMVQRRQHV